MNKFKYLQDVFASDLNPRAKLVLQCLIYHADREGMCFPSIKTIAAECGYGVSTVKRALNDLCQAGYICKQARFDERKNGGQTSNFYRLTADKAEASSEPKANNANSCEVEPSTSSEEISPREHNAFEYTYSFLDGMRKTNDKDEAQLQLEWTGGAVHFFTPLKNTVEL